MKAKVYLLILSTFILLVGCDAISKEIADNPEDALRALEAESKEREIIVYGFHQVNEALVLFVFRGVMNDQDIWVADIHKSDGEWKVKEIVQMNGLFADMSETQTVISNDDLGYEVGYMDSNVPVDDSFHIIDIEGIDDWKIWIKEL